MTSEELKKMAMELIGRLELCVVSSIGDDGRPQSALVGFSINDKFEVMVGTSKTSRKYQNILKDPRVAVLFGPHDSKAIQYEGTARELTGEELAQRKARHLKIRPKAQKYESDPDQTYFLIEPSWLRYVESGPKNLGEVKFA